ncbi:MAG: hypothetical protein REI11_20930, partial [Patulibacter sp.]|nr:hypothetical protein [Patulibacter sp.]
MTTFQRIFETRTSRVAAAVFVVVLVVGIFGGVLAPDDPLQQDYNATFLHVGAHGHLLGTDYL